MPRIRSFVPDVGLTRSTEVIYFRNPRDLRVVVFVPEDWDREMLSQQLKRIGCQVSAAWPPMPKLPDKTDLIFCAAMVQQASITMEWMGVESIVPVIAVVNYENPTNLELALRMGAKNILVSPFRTSGVFSILVASLHTHEEFQVLRVQKRHLEKKLLSARLISDAKAVIMRTASVSNLDAYESLRKQAMTMRISVEEVAQLVVEADTFLRSTTKEK
jgi:AmiR/NasT family two-component response regulator